MSLKFLALVCLSNYFVLLAGAPCPFSGHECKCTPQSPPEPLAFRRVDCRTTPTTLPKFSAQLDTKYTIDTLTISGGVADIPANYLTIFDSVSTLGLTQPSALSRPIYQNWDDNAFAGVRIMNIDITGLAGLIPPPAALRPLESALRRLSINAPRAPVEIDSGIFSQFPRLKTLWFRRTQVINVSDDAFLGLEGSMEELTLDGARISGYPQSTIGNLRRLKSLNLNQNGIANIPTKALAAYPALERLSLAGNPLDPSIQNGALDLLPPKLSRLYLDSVGLKAVPQRILQKQPTLATLSLSNNKIEGIRKGDFGAVLDLETINLNSNPISGIEDGSFSSMDQLVLLDLRYTNVTSIDLSVIASGLRLEELHLDFNAMLQYITVSDISEINPDLTITVTNTGLRTIDSVIGDLLDQKRSLVLDISNSGNLFCKDYEWMAKHALCTGRLRIHRATCFNLYDKPLDQHLRSMVPNLDCTGANLLR